MAATCSRTLPISRIGVSPRRHHSADDGFHVLLAQHRSHRACQRPGRLPEDHLLGLDLVESGPIHPQRAGRPRRRVGQQNVEDRRGELLGKPDGERP